MATHELALQRLLVKPEDTLQLQKKAQIKSIQNEATRTSGRQMKKNALIINNDQGRYMKISKPILLNA